jgi:hypothetical protein
MTTIATRSVRIAAAATIAIGIASQTAVDVANRSERSATIVAIQAPSIPPNVAVMRMRSIRQLRTLTPTQRTRIDETLGRYRQTIRDAATIGDPSREVGSLLADVENVLTPVQRRQVVDAPTMQ